MEKVNFLSKSCYREIPVVKSEDVDSDTPVHIFFFHLMREIYKNQYESYVLSNNNSKTILEDVFSLKPYTRKKNPTLVGRDNVSKVQLILTSYIIQ